MTPRRRLAVAAAFVAVLAALPAALLAQKGPESLLPPGFDEPPQAVTPGPRSGPGGPATRPEPRQQAPDDTSHAVVQPLPTGPSRPTPSNPGFAALDAAMTDEELLAAIDPKLMQLLVDSAKPKFDIPAAEQRSLAVVGVLGEADGGLAMASTRNLSGDYVGPLLDRLQGPLVSRWGQILVRRALASMLATPVGMNGADWAALRARVLLRIGEGDAARLLVQSVDSAVFTPALEDVALDTYMVTADPAGLCPVTQLTAADRKEWQWATVRLMCAAWTGQNNDPAGAIERSIRNGFIKDRIDGMLAEKYAGIVSPKRQAVKIEWDKAGELNPWRFGMALSTGLEPPTDLIDKAPGVFRSYAALAPSMSLGSRALSADSAGARGVLSSAAMVSLYGQVASEDDPAGKWGKLSASLRSAYVAPAAMDRLAAIKAVWGDDADPQHAYSRRVLTAYAAARIAPSDALADDAAGLIASMLTAGLDANALAWAPHVSQGSEAWGLLRLSSPSKGEAVSSSALKTYAGADKTSGQRRSQFLVAGLLGLGRIADGDAKSFDADLGANLDRQTAWTRAIDAAAQSNNPALVSFLAAFGMQGSGWDKMTALHLYHIVAALERVGLDGEARMIAAEAVSRA